MHSAPSLLWLIVASGRNGHSRSRLGIFACFFAFLWYQVWYQQFWEMGIWHPCSIKNDIPYRTGASDPHSMDVVIPLLVLNWTKMESLILLACDVLVPKDVSQHQWNENLTPLFDREWHSLSTWGLRFPFHWCCNTPFGTKRNQDGTAATMKMEACAPPQSAWNGQRTDARQTVVTIAWFIPT